MAKVFTKRVLFVLTIIANIIYITWRIFYTIPEGQGKISLFMAIGLLIVELGGMFEMFVHFHGMNKLEVPERPEIDLDLYPHVDVFIATYNEPYELVQKTINGCVHMDYPDKSKVHIYVCDDGSRREMEAVATKMGVNYLKRDEHKGAKAGNLNNAMKFSSSPLIVTFDADMIPMHDFLLSTVPYFLKNEQATKYGKEANYPKVGFIQTPQSFYNTDLFQFNLHSEGRIPNEQDYFYRDIQTAKNASNTVIYGGSNTILSRQAIIDAGGFFTNSITEDFATGMLIQSKKYHCYAIPEVHASGLSPDDLKSLIKQRERWGRGCIQTGRRVNLLFLKGLTIGQKISYFSSITYWYASIKRFFYIMAPIVFAVFGIQVVDCTLPEVLLFWLPTYCLTSITLKNFSKKIRNTRWTNIYETIMFNALMPAVILETLCIPKNSFSVTKKSKESTSDGWYRFTQAIPFIVYVVLSIIGICNMIYHIFLSESTAYVVVLFWLIANLLSLMMALFFLCGRVQLRKTERYLASVDCHITQGTLDVNTITLDVSEDGFSFVLDLPEYINPEKKFKAKFTMPAGEETYECTLEASIAQVLQSNGKWKYACFISKLSPEMRDMWNLIVHDRIPTLPDTIEQSMGFFEDLQVNIAKRTMKSPYFSRKTARTNMNYPCDVKAVGAITVKNFNYQYMLVEFANPVVEPLSISVKITESFKLKGTIVDNKSGLKGHLYKIENINKLMKDELARETIMSWLMEYGVVQEKKKKVKTPVAPESKSEQDLMDYV